MQSQMRSEQIFLKAVQACLESRSASRIEVEVVEDIGKRLNLSPEGTFEVVKRLQREGLAEMHWGETLRLTEKGKQKASSRSEEASTNIHLEEGATYVGEGANIGGGAALGQKAKGGDVNVQKIEVVPDELKAGLAELGRVQSTLAPETLGPTRPQLEELKREVEKILAESTGVEEPDEKKIEGHLEKARRVLEQLGSMAESAEKLRPALQLIAKGLGLASLSGLL